jgi:putative serine protease PepD
VGGQPPAGGQPPYAGYPGSAYPPPGHAYGAEFGAEPAPRKKGRGGLIALLAVTAIVAGAIGGGVGAALENNDSSGGSTPVSNSVDPKVLNRAPESIAGIAARALPSVVTISASNSQESGTGTGFVYDTDGHILTNNHVVAPSENGGKLSVKFSDGSSYPATIVGRASGYDVAVIKLATTPKKPLVPLALGNSDQTAVGDTTIAIGAPFGLSGTVTSGIVSAKNRPVASGDETGAQTSYMNALQTDASINPGNSGGPLMNAQGQVIGIDSAIQSTGSNSSSGGQSGSIGLGFAIPINQAKWVADQLIKTGKPTYPIIGVLRDDTFTGTGAKIASAPVQGQAAITPGGPADKAGLKPGDVITELGGVQIDSGPTLVSEIWSHHPGDVVSVTYTRDGKTSTTSLTLGSRVGDQ